MSTKVCGKCGVNKPLEQFRFRQDRKSYCSPCKKCTYLGSRAGRIKRQPQINDRYATDPKFKLQFCLRQRIRQAIKRNSKASSTVGLLGCSIPELKSYLEKKMLLGMSWDNHGNKGWHIDHIRPCASFDLSLVEQQKICFHYTNLQPLWWLDNLLKGDRIAAISCSPTFKTNASVTHLS